MLILAFMKNIIRNYNSWIWRSVQYPLLKQVLTFVFPWLLLHVINANKGILYMPNKILSHGLVAEILEINVCLPEDRSPGLSFSLSRLLHVHACRSREPFNSLAWLLFLIQRRYINLIYILHGCCWK
jgi:hypothetical protein